MSKLYKTGLLLCLIAGLTSCNNEDNNYSASFGGVITNPTTSYVVLSKDNQVIDTIPLDEDNHFFIKFDSLAPGLYSFKHDPDYQYVYFDKNDSLMVSINTVDFDESIVFSGRGDKKNNFMMDLFLKEEKDRDAAYEIYAYNFKKFEKIIDAAFSKRMAFYNKSKANIKWSEGFDFYANARLTMNYYTKKEYYPYINQRRTGGKTAPKMPDGFYDFRKKIDFNDPRLTNFSPFARYLTAMLNNMALAHKKSNKDSHSHEEALNQNVIKLNIADSMFSDEKIRNEVLNNIAFAYMLEDQNVLDNQKFLDRYIELSTDDNEKKGFKKMSEAVQSLKEGKKLPDIKLLDPDNKVFDIQNDISKKTVIFFWTACARSHLDVVYKKLELLKEKHKNIDFIAINVDEEREWKKIIDEHKFDNVQQLRAGDFQALKDKWVFTKINRTIILNSDGTIKNAFTNLMDDKFSENL